MNIFWLDNDLEKAAIAHCDKHVVKMILESAQLLSGVIHSINNDYGPIFDTSKVYRATHMNHPCAVWTRASSSNYCALLKLLEHLLTEYTYRYGKVHKTTAVYYELEHLRDSVLAALPSAPTPRPLAMPDEFKGLDAVESYRQYYKYKYGVISMKWTMRNAPDWLNIDK
jgi:hypothetical protein